MWVASASKDFKCGCDVLGGGAKTDLEVVSGGHNWTNVHKPDQVIFLFHICLIEYFSSSAFPS